MARNVSVYSQVLNICWLMEVIFPGFTLFMADESYNIYSQVLMVLLRDEHFTLWISWSMLQKRDISVQFQLWDYNKWFLKNGKLIIKQLLAAFHGNAQILTEQKAVYCARTVGNNVICVQAILFIPTKCSQYLYSIHLLCNTHISIKYDLSISKV